MQRFEGKVALVTGGAQGIGRGIALRLLEEGASVVVADVDEEAGREVEADFAAHGPIRFVACDTADEGAVARAVGTAAAAFGRLDALVNNAALAAPHNDPVDVLDLDAWNRVLAVNLTGYLLCTKHAVPHLRTWTGAIVNVASTRALQSEPDSEAYAAAKGGVVALTHALAVSLGPDVRVNVVSPGWIAVDEWQKASARARPSLRAEDHAQHPVGRVGSPADVAALVAYLLSDEAGFVTGAHFVIDGGMTRKMIYED